MVMGNPRLTLSTLNWTLAMVSPVPAVAVAVTGRLPETVAPEAGVVITTVVDVLLTVIPTGAEVVVLFAESVATAVRVCEPLLSLVESSTMV